MDDDEDDLLIELRNAERSIRENPRSVHLASLGSLIDRAVEKIEELRKGSDGSCG